MTELEACNVAAFRLKSVGFEFRYSSMKSEACYYGWPDRQELLRIAAHSHDNDVRGLGKVVSRLTLNRQSIKFKSPESMEHVIALAIGHYFLKSAAGMAKQADAAGLNPAAARREGSISFLGTNSTLMFDGIVLS